MPARTPAACQFAHGGGSSLVRQRHGARAATTSAPPSSRNTSEIMASWIAIIRSAGACREISRNAPTLE